MGFAADWEAGQSGVPALVEALEEAREHVKRLEITVTLLDKELGEADARLASSAEVGLNRKRALEEAQAASEEYENRWIAAQEKLAAVQSAYDNFECRRWDAMMTVKELARILQEENEPDPACPVHHPKKEAHSG